jgi:hypothetical protein
LSMRYAAPFCEGGRRTLLYCRTVFQKP